MVPLHLRRLLEYLHGRILDCQLLHPLDGIFGNLYHDLGSAVVRYQLVRAGRTEAALDIGRGYRGGPEVLLPRLLPAESVKSRSYDPVQREDWRILYLVLCQGTGIRQVL